MKNRWKKKEFLIGVTLILVFVAWTMWVMSENSIGFDTSIYDFLHSLPKSWETFFLLITRFGNTMSVIFICFVSLLVFRKAGKFICLNALLNAGLNNLLKIIIQRDRPSVPHLVEAKGYSYPSGHAMISISLYGFFVYLIHKNCKDKNIRYIAIFLCSIFMVFVPLSRVYLGVHFASDILAGIFVSSVYLYGFIKWIESKKFLS